MTLDQDNASEQLRVVPPATSEGIEKYLTSKIVKGLGPASAKKLVATFGAATFEVIEKEPDKLFALPGIGKKRIEKFLSAWREQAEIRQIMSFLPFQGVGPGRAARIYKVYGSRSIEAMRENPYALIDNVPGVGLKLAEGLAGALCSTCRRPLVRAKRVIGDLRYCPACAKRLLARRPCARCSQITTWPKDNTAEPLCPVCQVGDRTCVRCGRPASRVDLVLSDGVVCGSCAPYFKKARPCGYCGALRQRLARRPNLGLHKPACPKCQRDRDGHATCPVCGKSRRLVDAGDGRQSCARCAAQPEPFLCPQCGQPGQRHSQARCTTCYWRDHGRAKAVDSLPTLELTWSRGLFLACAGDLLDGNNDPRALALRLPRYGSFFVWLEANFPDQAAMSGDQLLDKLGADGLRRHATVLAWFSLVHGLILPSDQDLIAHSKQRRKARDLATRTAR